MKKSCAVIIINILAWFVFAGTAGARLPQPDLIAQIHFAGSQKIFADPGSHLITNEFCSAEALALRAQTAGKLSVWLAGWLQTNLNLTAPVIDGAAKLRPLLDDLQTDEWLVEARTAPNRRAELALAVKLPAGRADLWRTNLKSFFAAAAFKTAGDWLIFDSDPTLLSLGERLVQEIPALPPGWLYLDVNWPVFGQWYPEFGKLGLPETRFGIAASGQYVDVDGKFYFPQDIALKFDPWLLPTNSIHQPFDSFTAVRGLASWLRSQSWAQSCQLSPEPDQFISWALPMFPFQTFVATPDKNAGAALTNLYNQLIPAFATGNAKHEFMGSITPEMATNGVKFKGAPFLDVNIQALPNPSSQFLLLSLFPNTGRSGPLPPALLAQLSTKDLVYSHWEVTSFRSAQLLRLGQLLLVLTVHKQLVENALALKWLRKVEPSLGINNTMITQTGPAELTFTRQAGGIFTAMEFFALANWLEANNFPGCDLSLPAHFSLRGSQPPHPFLLTTPPPAPGH